MTREMVGATSTELKDRKRGWRGLRHRVALEDLPLRVDLRPRRWSTYLGLGFGALLLWASWPDLTGAGIWVLLPAAGIAIIVRALLMLMSNRTAVFGPDRVEVSGWRPFARESWGLPYSDFKGVLHREHLARPRTRPTTIQIVELLHDEPGRTLPLLVEPSKTRPREAWEGYARRLDLPALMDDGETLVVRDRDDLDKSMRALAAEGKVAPRLDAAIEAPPVGLEVVKDAADGGDRLRVTLTAGRLRPRTFLLVCALPALCLVIGAAESSILAIFGGGFIALAGAVFIFDRLFEREIEITRSRLTVTDAVQQRPTETMTFALDEIESIAIGHGRAKRPRDILIESDRTQVRVGRGLSPDALDWLKNFLTALIVTA